MPLKDKVAQVYGFTDLDGSRPDAWRYVAEIQDAGNRRIQRGIASKSLRFRQSREPPEEKHANTTAFV
jgi:hypothetical protein